MRLLVSTALYFACMMHAQDITILTGVQLTPNRTAIAADGLQRQISRAGPSAGIGARFWLSGHSGLFAESTLGNTNTQLADFALNSWTMNRVSVDGGYIYRIPRGRWTPYVRGGAGTMITISGHAPGGQQAGLDWRMEEIAGAGAEYRVGRRFSLNAEYLARFFRNPDFSDHSWRPERNMVSEPRIGITYRLGYSPE
jgi:hypothetical protein